VIDRLRQWLQRFFAVFRHTRIDRDHDAEVAEHLQLAIDENRRLGMSPAEARRQAVIHLGGVQQTKENFRDHLAGSSRNKDDADANPATNAASAKFL